MNIPTIVISILSSSIVSALVSYLIWIQQKKREFKYDYRKYILKKRIETYEEVEKVIALINSYVIDPSNNKKIHSIFLSKEDLLNAQKITIQFNNKGMWLSQVLGDDINEIHMIIYDGINGIKAKNDIMYLNYGFENFEKLKKLNDKISFTYFKDLKELSDLDIYFKERLREKKPGQLKN